MQFYKYQGTGNDFILLDNRSGEINLTDTQIEKLCHRRFGIGADGLMLLNAHPEWDFEMKYYNADGKPGSLCGNGSRCIVQFAYDLGVQKNQYTFLASDGPHQAERLADGRISLQMNDVSQIETTEFGLYLNTGSPHIVQLVDNLQELNVYEAGKAIRHNPRFSPGGTNVNFVQRMPEPNRIFVRTFERGVEDETFSCGTGVTACALALAHLDQEVREMLIRTIGGELSVRYQTTNFQSFHDIYLTGPAARVFLGEL